MDARSYTTPSGARATGDGQCTYLTNFLTESCKRHYCLGLRLMVPPLMTGGAGAVAVPVVFFRELLTFVRLGQTKLAQLAAAYGQSL